MLQHKIYFEKVLFLAISIMVFAGAPIEAQANNFFSKLTSNGGKFNLNRTINIVNETADVDTKIFSKRLQEHLVGCGAKEINITTVATRRNIFLRKVERIGNTPSTSNDCYSIKVSKYSVEVKYTSSKSMSWALSKLQHSIDSTQSSLQRFAKVYPLKFQPLNIVETSGEEGSFGVIDLSNNTLTLSAIEHKISRYAANHKFVVYLKLLSPSTFGIKSPLLEELNPTMELSKNGLTYDDLTHIFNSAKKGGIEVIVSLDFTTPKNGFFRKYTGHEMHSIEGLRFSTAFLSEFATSTPFKTISLGEECKNEVLKNKYITPLVKVLNSHNINVVESIKGEF